MGELVDRIADAVAIELKWTKASVTTHRIAVAALKALPLASDAMLASGRSCIRPTPTEFEMRSAIQAIVDEALK